MVWAALDNSADALLTELLQTTKERTLCISTKMERINGRLDIIKTLSMTYDMPSVWRDALNGTANQITNNLAPKRNRLVHDSWCFQGPLPAQLDKRAKIARPQSRQSPALVTEIRSEVSAETIEALIDQISQATVALIGATIDLEKAKERGGPPQGETLLVFLYQEWLHPKRSRPPPGP